MFVASVAGTIASRWARMVSSKSSSEASSSIDSSPQMATAAPSTDDKQKLGSHPAHGVTWLAVPDFSANLHADFM